MIMNLLPSANDLLNQLSNILNANIKDLLEPRKKI